MIRRNGARADWGAQPQALYWSAPPQLCHTKTHIYTYILTHARALLSLWLLGCFTTSGFPDYATRERLCKRNTHAPPLQQTCPPYLRTFTATYRTGETHGECEYQELLNKSVANIATSTEPLFQGTTKIWIWYDSRGDMMLIWIKGVGFVLFLMW